jgi:hypothetical protein
MNLAAEFSKDLWRKFRKMSHLLAMSSATLSYEQVQICESERLLCGLLREPSKYEDLFELYAGGLILKLAYDITVDSNADILVNRALEIAHAVERVASPDAYLVDTFPFS